MLGWFRRLQGSRAISSNKLIANARQALAEYGGSSVAEVRNRTTRNDHQEEKKLVCNTLVLQMSALGLICYKIMWMLTNIPKIHISTKDQQLKNTETFLLNALL